MLSRHVTKWLCPQSIRLFSSRRLGLKIRVAAVVLVLLIIETLIHVHNVRVRRPSRQDSDRPFQIGCRMPPEKPPKANATILMLARNEDVEGALHAIESLERNFNRWFKYPVLFLNDKPWNTQFIEVLSKATSGAVSFDVIPEHMWSFPDWINPEEARASMRRQGSDSIPYGELESYHHMCRFYSGMFYDVPSLQNYRWFWRVEPDVDFTCLITYDPFVAMEKSNKRYGYTIALWEVGRTAPNLFHLVDQYKEQLRLGTDLWKAMIDAAWLPWPFRKLLSYLPHHTTGGDYWNFCHYWSNFEIADLDFFRSEQYRDFFNYLDRSGGFYFERFGDAPIHSLAAALFLQPKQIHHFEDIGYRHSNLWTQPNNAWNLQLPNVDIGAKPWAEEVMGASGCRCEKKEGKVLGETTNVPETCLKRLGSSIKTL